MTSVSNGKDLPINKPVEFQETTPEALKKEFDKCDRAFKEAHDGAQKNALSIAQLLFYIQRNGLYTADGYETIADYALDRYGISKSTVSKYIGIMEYFGAPSISSKTYTMGGYRELKEKYRGYGWSKLAIMYQMDGKLLSKVTSEMSYRQILNLMDADKARKRLEAKKTGDGDVEKPVEADIKEVPTISRVNRFKIRTGEDLDGFIKFLSDKDCVKGLKDELEKGGVLSFDLLTVTKEAKAEVSAK